jgi:adenylate cyclase
MAIEIERKFLLCNDDWRKLVVRTKHICQGYLGCEGGLSTRVRIVDNCHAKLAVKSGRASLRRLEFEYPIPLADAEQLLSLRHGELIIKVRHIVPWHGLTWEIDEFQGNNAGLVIAEIELDHETQSLELPHWVGAEITGQVTYYNSSLAVRPFRSWTSRHTNSDWPLWESHHLQLPLL